MLLLGGRVRDIAESVENAIDRVVADCAGRFVARYGATPSDQEQTSWRNSWPALVTALVRAGLGELWLGLEYRLPGTGERIDALLLGASGDGRLTGVVIELKQWDHAELLVRPLVRAHGRTVPHPCEQAAGYVRYLRTWLDVAALGMEVRAVAVLHNAPPALVTALAGAVSGRAGAEEVALVGRQDLAASVDEVVAGLGCVGLTAPGEDQVKRFLTAPHRPAPSLFAELGTVLRGDPVFELVGEQQRAYLRLLGAIRHCVSSGERAMLVVTGGPGTGKTVIAMRLLADIRLERDPLISTCEPRYLTSSGTLSAQLRRAADDPGARGLIMNVQQYLKTRPEPGHVLLVDEAQRLYRRGHTRAGTRSLSPFNQAVLVLRWFLDGTRVAQMAADNQISRSTTYDYLHEGFDVLAARAPALESALLQVQIDSTSIDVMVLSADGIPVRADLTISVDVVRDEGISGGRARCVLPHRRWSTKPIRTALLRSVSDCVRSGGGQWIVLCSSTTAVKTATVTAPCSTET